MNFDSTIDFKSKKIQRFLINQNQTKFQSEYTLALNYEEGSSRFSKNIDNEKLEFPYIKEKIYSVDKALGSFNAKDCEIIDPKKRIGTVKSKIVMSQEIEVGVKYIMTYRDIISQSNKDLINNSFDDYDADQHGSDIEIYIKDNLPQEVSENWIEILTVPTVAKTGYEKVINDEQDKVLRRTYCKHSTDDPIERTDCDVYEVMPNGENINYNEWMSIKKQGLSFLRENPSLKDEPESDNVIEVDDLNDEADLKKKAAELLEGFIQPSCLDSSGVDHFHKKILRLISWPEFKIEWLKKRIKIGCSTITVPWPKIYTRTTSILLYAHYIVPVRIDRIIKDAIGECAVYAALSGGVAGVVLGNLPAAIAVFKSSFKICVEEYILSCFHGELYLAKKKTQWSAA